ncbi:hypothetical protein BDW74DRAFT_140003 [Aspergillus multicolor]|uniref:uncharacterized protein n=1 Tax=Aspergillus multicolor TaxID=41759 RepID=UPI003CCCF20D
MEVLVRNDWNDCSGWKEEAVLEGCRLPFIPAMASHHLLYFDTTLVPALPVQIRSGPDAACCGNDLQVRNIAPLALVSNVGRIMIDERGTSAPIMLHTISLRLVLCRMLTSPSPCVPDGRASAITLIGMDLAQMAGARNRRHSCFADAPQKVRHRCLLSAAYPGSNQHPALMAKEAIACRS